MLLEYVQIAVTQVTGNKRINDGWMKAVTSGLSDTRGNRMVEILEALSPAVLVVYLQVTWPMMFQAQRD
jgi:hypothetical protein